MLVRAWECRDSHTVLGKGKVVIAIFGKQVVLLKLKHAPALCRNIMPTYIIKIKDIATKSLI